MTKPINVSNEPDDSSLGDLIRQLEEKVEQSPEDIRSLLMLGNSYYISGKISRAIGVFQKVIQLDTQVSHAYYHIGIAYYRSANLEEAIQSLQKAAESNPTLVMTYYWLGLAYYHKGLYTQSREAFETLLEKNEESVIAHYHAALSCVADLAWERARYHLERLLEQDRADPQVYLLLGKVLFRLHRVWEAVEVYKKGLVLNPGNPALQEAVEFLMNVQEP